MLVKKVQRYFPSKILKGFIAIASSERIPAEIRAVKTIKATTFIRIKRVFKLIELKKPFCLPGFT